MEYFIKLKDFEKNEEEVICSIFSTNSYECQYQFIFEKIVESFPDVLLESTISKDEKKMVICKVENVLNKGYIYNTNTIQKKKMFELTLLKINKIYNVKKTHVEKEVEKNIEKDVEMNIVFVKTLVKKDVLFNKDFKFKFTEELKSKLTQPRLGLFKVKHEVKPELLTKNVNKPIYKPEVEYFKLAEKRRQIETGLVDYDSFYI